jgi:cell fate regulator YaaT (PSP1 superfamily)
MLPVIDTGDKKGDTVMPAIIGVRFQKLGKIYHFDAGSYVESIRPGDYVMVTTSRGKQIGQVICFVTGAAPNEGERRTIDRLASAQDLLLQRTWKEREEETLAVVKDRAQALKIKGVRFHAAIFDFDGTHLSILYSTETDEKLDLKPLRSDIAQRFSHQQIELRQIGPRDVARHLCGLGACGLQERCCAQFLGEFNPISIKMAKAQGISLNPGEITGMCGRLRCCLIYEYDQYAEARQRLPKRGKRVQTPRGPGRVAEVFPLRDGILVDLGEELGTAEFQSGEIHLLEEQNPNTPHAEENDPKEGERKKPGEGS